MTAEESQIIDEAVSLSWEQVMHLVEGGHPLSSEKTLCFLFAMELWKYFNGELQLDFENQCYETLQGKSKYLDLLAIMPNGSRLAFELKLPQSSELGNSNQTQTRVAVYRDLARLSWLRTQSIDIGYFLMATNEDAYLNNANLKEHPELLTRHGHTIVAGNAIEVDDVSASQLSCRFSWIGVNGEGPFKKPGRYAWLNPIKV